MIEVENLLGKTIRTLRSDRSGEYMNLRFQDNMIEHGIMSQLSAPGMLGINLNEKKKVVLILLILVRFFKLSREK